MVTFLLKLCITCLRHLLFLFLWLISGVYVLSQNDVFLLGKLFGEFFLL